MAQDVTGLPAHATVAAGLTLVPEGRAILGRMTIEENLRLAGERRQPAGGLAAAIEDQYRRFPVLGERRRQLAGSLSGGQQQMLAFARALAGQAARAAARRAIHGALADPGAADLRDHP